MKSFSYNTIHKIFDSNSNSPNVTILQIFLWLEVYTLAEGTFILPRNLQLTSYSCTKRYA